ncbi:MAG: IclR family transcriptional regulator [Bryobacteraceae bacterium]
MKKDLATNSLQRGLELLSVLAQKPGGLTNSELSRHLDIPRSTCTYILTRMEADGYIVRNTTTGRYKVGLKTLAFARAALREVGFHSLAESSLYRLAQETRLAAILGVLEGDRALIIDHIESPEFIEDMAERGRSRWPHYPSRDLRDAGSPLPLHASGIGRVLLAYQPETALKELLNRIPLIKLTPKTTVSKQQLLEELVQIRQQGYGLTDQLAHMDAQTVTAPIFDPEGNVRAAVSAAGSRTLPAFQDVPRIISLVQGAAREISKKLTQPAAADRDPDRQLTVAAPVKNPKPKTKRRAAG